MKFAKWWLIVACLIIGFLFWWFSPRQIVKRHSAEIFDLLNLQRADSRAFSPVRNDALNRLLDEQVLIEASSIEEIQGTFHRSDLVSSYAWFYQAVNYSSFGDVRFSSISVQNNNARVSVDVRGLVEMPSIRVIDSEYQVLLEWRFEKDAWVLSRMNWKKMSDRR